MTRLWRNRGRNTDVGRGSGTILKNLLVYRFLIFNTLMGFLLGFLSYKGYVSSVIAGDSTGISLLITGMFVILFGSTTRRVWTTSRGLNRLKDITYSMVHTRNHVSVSVYDEKRLIKIRHIGEGASWLAYLGLIGTVVGFIISLSGADPSALSPVQGVQTMIPNLMRGMMVALYTTITGSFFGIWTEINYRILHTATSCLCIDEKKIEHE